MLLCTTFFSIHPYLPSKRVLKHQFVSSFFFPIRLVSKEGNTSSSFSRCAMQTRGSINTIGMRAKSHNSLLQTPLCYVMLCYVMLCYVMLCYVMLCYVMLCYVMLCYVMLCYVMLCYVMLCYVMLCYVMLCYVMLCYVMLCYVMLCYVMLCYVMLCYVVCTAEIVCVISYYNSLRRHCSGFDVFLAGINEKLASTPWA